jgi:hypothetical protein
MIQQIRAADPTAVAAKYEPNSQPEPMIEVSDAQVAPISPISLLRPTSAGLVSVAATAMSEPSSLVRIQGRYARA